MFQRHIFSLSAHRNLTEVDCSLGQFKSAKLKDKEFTVNSPNFYTTLKKERDAPIFLNLLAIGQLLIYLTDAVSPSIRYLWSAQ